mmetsp:Transcript_105812/g.326405  ORF Transcript_105812/g.326405 Transcript_105812/m.326405 type:complete len:243 (+) Transcript_105812:1097-1825(+)
MATRTSPPAPLRTAVCATYLGTWPEISGGNCEPRRRNRSASKIAVLKPSSLDTLMALMATVGSSLEAVFSTARHTTPKAPRPRIPCRRKSRPPTSSSSSSELSLTSPADATAAASAASAATSAAAAGASISMVSWGPVELPSTSLGCGNCNSTLRTEEDSEDRFCESRRARGAAGATVGGAAAASAGEGPRILGGVSLRSARTRTHEGVLQRGVLGPEAVLGDWAAATSSAASSAAALQPLR